MKRQCRTCGERLELDCFPLGASRRRTQCIECIAAEKRKYYQANKEKFKERSAKQELGRKYWRALVLEAYGSKCACCGESHPLMLAIDHKNNDGCEWRKIHGNGRKLYKWLNAMGYPSDFQLLCHNCNFAKHLNGGTCPHQEGSTTIPKGSRAERPEAPSPA